MLQGEKPIMKTNSLLLLVVPALLVASLASADDASEMKQRIAAQQMAPDRHEWDQRRDVARKPYQAFMFLGLEPGMHVMDVWAGAGYTSEMLSAAVGPSGKVYSHNTEVVLNTYADGYYKTTMDERLANNRLPNTVLHISDIDDFGLDEELDLVFWGNNLHDYYYHEEGQVNALDVLVAIKKALKPGGILAVMDHVGVAEGDNAKMHRIDPDIVRDLLKEAGYVIEEESALFANPEDGHDLMVYDEKIYLKTDRILIRARKP
jgi:predicted methyltransferase